MGTSRHVRNEHYETVRFLLAADGVGVTITDITLVDGVRATYGYEKHIEIAYCISGKAQIFDLSNQQEHVIESGALWIAPKGCKFEFIASEPTRLICVFTPPFEGQESGFVGKQ